MESPPHDGRLLLLAVPVTADDPPALADYLGDLGPLEPGDPDGAAFGRGCGMAAMGRVGRVSLLLAPDQVHPSVPFAEAIGSALVASCETRKDRFAILSADRDYSHKAPANAIVIGAKGLQTPVTEADQERLNPAGVNCLRDGRGIRVWGARTMKSDPESKSISVRRLFVFLEESINKGTRWVVFEPNAPPTWARVVKSVSAFLSTAWRNGALVGATPDEAFFVECDRTTMTQDDIDAGRLICDVGVAPVTPAEFVIFRIGQKTADVTA